MARARRISNIAFYAINTLSLFVALVAVSAALYFRFGCTASPCQRTIRQPLLVAGLLLFLVSVLGLVGSWCSSRNRFGLAVYFSVMIMVVMALVVMAFLVLVVTSRSASRRVKALGGGRYGGWLKKHFIYGEHWDHLRTCLAESDVCKTLHSHHEFSEFMRQDFSPVQSGCCKPPVYCGFRYKNLTYWEEPKGGPEVADADCEKWKNDEETLCYDCDSCKREVLFSLKKQWRLWALLIVTALVLILVTLNIAGCACRNNHRHRWILATQATAPHP